MGLLEAGALIALALLALKQIGAGLIFAIWCLTRLRRPSAGRLPAAIVVLPVRGADSRLRACLEGIAQQDYPNYRVRIVIDRRGDPSEAILEQVRATLGPQEANRFDVQMLREVRTTCSLKCSAVYEATEELPGDCQVVATIDSDIVPHKTWLRELVSPLADNRVGAAMGNRWYAPRDGGWGSIVCYLWNAPVVVTMFFMRIPWGGSLAVDADILRKTDLRQRWLKAGCEDIPLASVLTKLGRRLEFVPSVLMVSREERSLSGCLRFINRQFVWTLLYHPLAWWRSAILYGVTAIAILFAVALSISSAVRGEWIIAVSLAGGVVGFFIVESLMLMVLELVARRMIARQGESGCPLRLKTFLCIPLTQALAPLMFVRSLLSRRIDWRGAEYEIGGPWKIQLLSDLPVETRRSAAAPVWNDGSVEFPNLLSRLFLKRAFSRQFIIPPEPPVLLEQFLIRYENSVLRPDVSDIRIDRPIFMVGLHRSGTTLLQDLLCLHPQLGYINNAMPSFRRCFCAAEHFRKQLKLDFRGQRMLGDSVEITAGSPNEGVAFWREWLGEDHHDLSWTGLRYADLTSAQIERIHSSIRKILWCQGPSATRFFCKNPSLLPHLELLAELFPDARFVHIIRDARGCANSMIKLYRLEQAQLDRIRASGKHGIYDSRPYVAFPRLPHLAEYVERFGADSIETTARLWNDALDEVERVKSLLPSFYEVRYEDILADPQNEIERILEFCELPAIEPEHHAYWQKLANVGRLRHSNHYADYDRIESICGDKLVKYGYLLGSQSLSATPGRPPALTADS